jgi:hypothetical protein
MVNFEINVDAPALLQRMDSHLGREIPELYGGFNIAREPNFRHDNYGVMSNGSIDFGLASSPYGPPAFEQPTPGPNSWAARERYGGLAAMEYPPIVANQPNWSTMDGYGGPAPMEYPPIASNQPNWSTMEGYGGPAGAYNQSIYGDPNAGNPDPGDGQNPPSAQTMQQELNVMSQQLNVLSGELQQMSAMYGTGNGGAGGSGGEFTQPVEQQAQQANYSATPDASFQ